MRLHERVGDALARRAAAGMPVEMAGWAPPAVEIASFLTGNASQVRTSRDQLVDDARDIWAGWGEDALRLGLVAGPHVPAVRH